MHGVGIFISGPRYLIYFLNFLLFMANLVWSTFRKMMEKVNLSTALTLIFFVLV